MNKNKRKHLVHLYEIALPILSLCALFILMTLGASYFHPGSQPFPLFIVNNIIWLIFFFDFSARAALSSDRGHFVTSHLAELISILPIMPIILISEWLYSIHMSDIADTILNTIFIIKFFAYLTRTFIMQRRFIKTNELHYAAAVSMTALVVAAVLFSSFENRSYSDGIWWAFVTASTTGFGDVVPKTPEGRLVGMFLMVIGLSCISMLTGVIAGRMMQTGTLRERRISPHIDFVIQQLNKFETLSGNDVDEICTVLKSLKANEKLLPNRATADFIRKKHELDQAKCKEKKLIAWLRKTFTPSPEDDKLIEKKITS